MPLADAVKVTGAPPDDVLDTGLAVTTGELPFNMTLALEVLFIVLASAVSAETVA